MGGLVVAVHFKVPVQSSKIHMTFIKEQEIQVYQLLVICYACSMKKNRNSKKRRSFVFLHNFILKLRMDSVDSERLQELLSKRKKGRFLLSIRSGTKSHKKQHIHSMTYIHFFLMACNNLKSNNVSKKTLKRP